MQEEKSGTYMFEKKEYLYSETMGVCRVAEIVRLSGKGRVGEPVPYYHLKAVADKTKSAYIPVENHQVALRRLIGYEEACAVTQEELEGMDENRRAEVRFVREHGAS